MFNRIKDVLRGKSGKDSPSDAIGPAEPAPSAGASAEPLTLQHVWTPEPNAVKLQTSRMILPLGEKRNYPAPETAQDSPLAQALFEITGVLAVELDGVSVQVTMDEEADWDMLMERIPEVILRHFESGFLAVEGLDPQQKPGKAAKKKYSFGFREIPEGSRSPEEQRAIIQKVLDEEINPAVAAHGGYFDLIAVENNNVYVQLGGGCQGCGMVDVTLRQGVEQRMKEVLPEMHELIDVTDHRAGTNPYYQPGK
jgi:Fe-S cluster biogenesis protein NfuA